MHAHKPYINKSHFICTSHATHTPDITHSTYKHIYKLCHMHTPHTLHITHICNMHIIHTLQYSLHTYTANTLTSPHILTYYRQTLYTYVPHTPYTYYTHIHTYTTLNINTCSSLPSPLPSLQTPFSPQKKPQSPRNIQSLSHGYVLKRMHF